MSDWLKIFITSGTTLIGGIILLIFKSILVDTVVELKKHIAEIGSYVFKSHCLLADEINPTQDTMERTFNHLQDLSARLRSLASVVPFYCVFSRVKILPAKKDLFEAAKTLSRLSYSNYEDDKEKISDSISNIYELLKIDMHGDNCPKAFKGGLM